MDLMTEQALIEHNKSANFVDISAVIHKLTEA